MTRAAALTGQIEKSPREIFLAEAAAGYLAYQVSVPTGQPVFYPRIASPVDGSELEWRRSAGRGVVHASTVVRPRGEAPFNVSMIELDEGFRMMSTVTDLDPELVRIGLRVAVRFAPTTPDGPPLPVFAPEEES